MPISFKQERGWGRGGVRSWSVSQVPGCESTRVSCAHFLFSLFSVFVFASFSPFLGPFLLWHLRYFPSHQHEKVSSVRVLGSVMQCIVSASWDTPWALPLPPSLSPRLPVSLSLLGGSAHSKVQRKRPWDRACCLVTLPAAHPGSLGKCSEDEHAGGTAVCILRSLALVLREVPGDPVLHKDCPSLHVTCETGFA